MKRKADLLSLTEGEKNPFNYIPNVLFSNYNHTPADPLTRKMISRAGRQTFALDLPHRLKSHGRQVKLWELLEPNPRWWLDQLSMKREPSVMTTDGGAGRVGGSERERGGVGNFIRTLFLSNLARTWTSFVTLTFVSSSRNTIQEEFFPKECDKLREKMMQRRELNQKNK